MKSKIYTLRLDSFFLKIFRLGQVLRSSVSELPPSLPPPPYDRLELTKLVLCLEIERSIEFSLFFVFVHCISRVCLKDTELNCELFIH